MTLTDACQFNDRILSELELLLSQLPDQSYPNIGSSVSSSIGPHVRHLIEFYHCFFQGLNFGVIDYDNRPRNTELENDRETALEYVKNLRLLLTAQDLSHHPEYVEVVACTGIENQRIQAQSSLARELMFLQSHSTHHLAMIALLMEKAEIPVPQNLGLATSTRLFLESTVQSEDE